MLPKTCLPNCSTTSIGKVPYSFNPDLTRNNYVTSTHLAGNYKLIFETNIKLFYEQKTNPA